MAKPVAAPLDENDVPKVDDAVAVGEDLAFQERWWKFERIVWVCFALILLADVLGVFGRGWLARARIANPAAGMQIEYERVERASTPSIITVHVQPDAIVNHQIQLFASESIVKELGAQRIVPQPQQSTLGDGGITYTFPADSPPATIQFELQPSFPGVHAWTMQVPGKAALGARVVVVP